MLLLQMLLPLSGALQLLPMLLRPVLQLLPMLLRRPFSVVKLPTVVACNTVTQQGGTAAGSTVGHQAGCTAQS